MTENNIYFYLTNNSSVYIFLTESDKKMNKKCYSKFYEYLLFNNHIKNLSDEVIVMEICEDKLNIIKISNNSCLLSCVNDFSARDIFKLFERLLTATTMKTKVLTFTNYKPKITSLVFEGLKNYRHVTIGEEYRVVVCDSYEYWWKELEN